MTTGIRYKEDGFTLLEILLAIAIFAMVATLAYGAYRASFQIIQTTESQVEIYNKARVALDRLSQDLGSLYLGPTGFLQGKPQTIGSRQADTLRFTSRAHLVFNKNELAAGSATISYRLEEDPESKELMLYRQDTAFRPVEEGKSEESDPRKGLLLCDGLQEVAFLYYSRQGEEQDNWDSKEIEKADSQGQRQPGRIAIRLLFSDPAGGEEPVSFQTAVAFPEMAPAPKEKP